MTSMRFGSEPCDPALTADIEGPCATASALAA
jgi:hypothetical protein